MVDAVKPARQGPRTAVSDSGEKRASFVPSPEPSEGIKGSQSDLKRDDELDNSRTMMLGNGVRSPTAVVGKRPQSVDSGPRKRNRHQKVSARHPVIQPASATAMQVPAATTIGITETLIRVMPARRRIQTKMVADLKAPLYMTNSRRNMNG
jgi:hypothetical protein